MRRSLFLTALLCMALLFTVGAFASDAVVYLDGTGATEGAYTDLKTAVSALPNGGTVIVTGDTTVGTTSAGVTLAAVGGKVTIKGETPSVKLTIARSLTLASELVIDDLTLNSTATASGNILCYGNAITVGEGVTTTKSSGGMWLAIIGGAGSGTKTYDTSVTVYAGTWRALYGGNYDGTLNGTSTVTVGNVHVTGTLSYANYLGACNASGTLIFDLRGNKTVTAGIYRDGEVPTMLTDDGYEAVKNGNTYSQNAATPAVCIHSYQDGICTNCGESFPSDTAYVDTGVQNGDGLTPATAFSSLEDAMRAFGKDGGTILLCSDVTLGTTAAGVTLPATPGKITVKGTSGQTLSVRRTLFLSGDLELDDLVLNSAATAMGNIYCNGHTFTVSAGVTCTKTGSMWLALFGGAGDETLTADTHLILHGGTWRAVYGGNYKNTLVGDTLIEIGGAVSNGSINGGNYQGTHTGNMSVVVDLRGDKTATGTWVTEPTAILTDDGYEVVKNGNTYSQYKVYAAEPRTVYLDGTGKTAGAYTSLTAALKEMPGGGTIILSGRTEIKEATTLPRTDAILITSQYEDEDYTRTAELCLYADLTLGADTTLKNVALEKIHASNLYLIAAGHALVIDEGVACLNYQANNNISIVGGCYNAPFEGDTHVTVKSGTWRNLFGGNYYNTFKGNTYVTVSGGVFENAIVGGSYSGAFTGDTHLTVNGNATLPASKSPQGVVGATLGVDSGTQHVHTGDVYLTVGGNAGLSTNIFGGPRNKNITMNGNVEVVFEDDAFCYFSIYTGGYANGINGNARLIVNGGSIWGSLFGGSNAGAVTGDTLIELHGGKVCYYRTNEFSGGSDLPGTKNVYAGGAEGATVSGTQTVIMDGGSVYGNIFGGNVTVTNGFVFGGLSGENVTVDLSAGGEVTLLDKSAITSLIGGGKLNLSATAPATIGSVSGNTEFAIGGLPLPIVYMTVENVEDGASITYLAQDTETLTVRGNTYAIDFDGACPTVELTVTFAAGMTCRLRDNMGSTGGWYTPISQTDTSMTFAVKPGLYTATVVSKTNNSDYRRSTLYITGREAAQSYDATFSANDNSGYYMNSSRSFPAGLTEQYYSYETFGIALDTPYFTQRYGTPDEIIQTTNAEVVAYVNEKAANCSYMYVFDLCTSPSGYAMPLAIFTKDPIPEGATLEEIAAIVHSKGEREILYIDGGIHGNEPSGTEGNLVFINEMCGAYGEEVLANEHIGAILVQPRLNPEGFFTSTRESLGNQVQNLNRDFMVLTSAEISSVVYIDRLFMPTIAVDCHEALFVDMTASGLQSDIYDVGIMCYANYGCGFIDATAVVYGDRSASYYAGDDFVRTVRADLESMGFRTYWYNKDRSPVYGCNYHGVGSAYSFIMETPGIVGGADHMPRRTITHVLGLKSFVQIAIDGKGSYAAEVAAARRSVALAAQDYDGKAPTLLQHATSRTAEVVYEWNDAIVGADGVVRAEETVRGWNYDIAMVYRDLPTAYVFPADVENLADVLTLLDKHGIAYTELPAGTTLTLRRYGGKTTAATLGDPAEVTFAAGAYLVPVDTYRATLIASLMEPDNRDKPDANPSTIAQAGLLDVTDLYRSTERFIAAKMGIAGTYVAIDIPKGKTVEAVTVDGAAPEHMAVEDGKVFIAPENTDDYTATLFFTDGTTYSIGLAGDVNGDGVITLADALAVLRSALNGTNLPNGDMNGDGKITLLDALRLLKLAAN